MEDPQLDIRNVVRNLTEPRDAEVMLATVDKYFSPNAVIIHPMLNSPKEHGREGVKAAYKMLRVLTIGNKIDFHCCGWDRVVVRKGVEHQVGLLDLTESLTLRFLPLSEKYNPVFNIRFLVRVDLEKGPDDLWYITRQEDVLPITDFGSTGLRLLPGLTSFSNGVKWVLGTGTLVTSKVITKLGLFQ